MASGSGSNFEAIVRAVKKKKIKNAVVALVITDQENAFVRCRARRHGIKDIFVDPAGYKSRELFDRHLVRLIKNAGADLVVLAGYMRVLTPGFVKAFRNRVVNIHPALLPAFKGVNAIERAYRRGVKVTGVTVHFIDEQVDHGPIIAQKALEVRAGESLASLEQRVHRVEHRLYSEMIDHLLREKTKVKGRYVSCK